MFSVKYDYVAWFLQCALFASRWYFSHDEVNQMFLPVQILIPPADKTTSTTTGKTLMYSM